MCKDGSMTNKPYPFVFHSLTHKFYLVPLCSYDKCASISFYNNYTVHVTLNTEFDTLWLSPGNFQSAGSILTNDTLLDRRGPWAST